MAFASRDQIRQAITAGRVQRWQFAKDGEATNETPDSAGAWVSYYLAVGTPGAAVAPTTYANLTDFSGSMFNTAVSPGNRYLSDAVVCSTQTGTLMVYDRLGHIGAIDITTVASDTISSSALPRSMGTNDLNNVEAWLEVTTATNGAITLSMNSYTNQAGTTTRAGGSITIPSGANIGYMAKFPLQAGDKAVQSLQTIAVSAEAATAGIVNVVLLRPLAYIPIATANVATAVEIAQLPRVYDGSSLFFAFLATGTSVADVWGELTMPYDA
jgi:hypothetical protein